MLSFEMVCSCEAAINMSIEGEDTMGGWYLLYRFANAHVKCGYMTPPEDVEESPDTEQDTEVQSS